MRISKYFFFLACLLISTLLPHEDTAAKTAFAYFVPPQDWLFAPDALSKHVKYAFCEPNPKGFRATILFATEEVNVGISDYLKAVKKIYEKDSQKNWKKLGKIKTVAGEAILTQIDTTTSQGAVRLLQSIFIKDGTAYLITATTEKKTFSQYLDLFEKTFQSFNLIEDLSLAISEKNRRQELQKLFLNTQTEEDQKRLESIIEKDYADLGLVWQTLAVQATRENQKSLRPITTVDKISSSPLISQENSTLIKENMQ